ncbi:Glycosyl transferase family 2 [Bremerella volcania]|uniref:Glycosyl transferase family 2 n=1 Tax=Bremerella volcania TaxID=2527984 RepID=A0A518C3B9_9BACT|nr:glycosyltransferase family A protein [Bremerella volcania]QDU73721.1 Glycosyl transferase family 2 [Bremerella volcania]
MRVSCIMVTGHKPERRRLAEVAIGCFNQQTWPDRELVIVNEGEPFNLPGERLVPTGATLGELRNLGLSNADGDLIIQWDDDDWYHPDRIRVQAEAWKPGHAVILNHEIICDMTSGQALVCTVGFPGSILHEAQTTARYETLRKGEDSVFADSFRRIHLNNNPTLYIRFWHGLNTWDRKHFQSLARISRPLTEDENLQLQRALSSYQCQKVM